VARELGVFLDQTSDIEFMPEDEADEEEIESARDDQGVDDHGGRALGCEDKESEEQNSDREISSEFSMSCTSRFMVFYFSFQENGKRCGLFGHGEPHRVKGKNRRY
jgi:hypothetical protein